MGETMASCLCGAVRIAVARAPETVTQCNCSACARLGTLWAYYSPRDVRIEGATRLTRAVPAIWNFIIVRSAAAPPIGRRSIPHRMGVNARLMAAELQAAARRHLFDGLNALK